MVVNWLRLHPIVLVVLFLNFSARAQTTATDPSQAEPSEWKLGGYVVHQSVEIGYRTSDVTGSQQMYNSLVNEQSGPRFLDQSLSMQSQNHEAGPSTTCSSIASGGEATPITASGRGWTRTIGTTSGRTSGATKRISTITFWRIRLIRRRRAQAFPLPLRHISSQPAGG